jgi:hypothetical protein
MGDHPLVCGSPPRRDGGRELKPGGPQIAVIGYGRSRQLVDTMRDPFDLSTRDEAPLFLGKLAQFGDRRGSRHHCRITLIRGALQQAIEGMVASYP